jgi:molybdopterin molybdotransferase
MLSFTDARQKVIEVVTAMRPRPTIEKIELGRAAGRVLAERLAADRDYPPFDRSTRDGFAIRSADAAAAGATLRRIGEVKAGSAFDGVLASGECVQIMTGAPVPAGADAVVMIEQTRMQEDRVTLERSAAPGQNIVPRGNEARAGQDLLLAGTRLGYAEIALAAQSGHDLVRAFVPPRVAILSTGDEVVDVSAQPGPFQVRNGNSLALEVLTTLAGGRPHSLGNAPDERGELRRRIRMGLEADVLVLSGGVSAGKYDLVETVLAELGAETFFDAVAIRPGRPAVFCQCGGKPVFGLPGNPVSTMVTFELFVLPALDLLGGAPARPPGMLGARLTHAVHEKPGMTHFLPAQVDSSRGEPEVSVLPWQGSGDTVTIAKANAFLVVPAERPDWEAGEWATVLPRRGSGGVLG